MTKLCLGTVQFGMKYGVNNQIGRQPTWEESFEMIDAALDAGVDAIDTARAYGEAELVLGEYFRRNPHRLKGLRIVSKLRPNVVEPGCVDVAGTVRRELEETLERIGVGSVDGYLLHTPEYVYDKAIVDAMRRMREEGLASNIGVSIYDTKDGFAAIEDGFADYVQLPYSILDQRGVRDGFICAAKEAGVTVAARSAFLQGLFMMDRTAIPAHLQTAIPHLDVIQEVLAGYGVDLVSGILGFVAAEKDIDYLVFGVEAIGQMREDLEKFAGLDVPAACVAELKERVGDVDESIIFPSLWSNGKKAE